LGPKPDQAAGKRHSGCVGLGEFEAEARDILAGIDLQGLLGRFDEGVIVTDPEGRIVFYNAAQSKIDDLPIDYVLGRQVTEIYNLTGENSQIMRCLDQGEPIYAHRFFYQTRRGKVADTICSAFPLRHADKLAGCICFIKVYHLDEEPISDAPRRRPDKRNTLGKGTRFQFTDIIGADTVFLQGVKIARLAADSPSPIMLFGETGSGKEVFAQSIHNYSGRGEKPFVAINCAAIPENLLEGLLFGTTRGAFTGAVNRQGIFEQAHGGTLFLDEIHAMPTNLQAKLLRVLQERCLRRVGGTEEIAIDLKILSSVNVDPHTDIEAGRLRMDLYYRLGVVFIAIPPLRRRPTDIELLTRHFIHRHNDKLGKLVNGISTEVMDLFRRYPWPGNVRELAHVVEGTLNVMTTEDRIERRHLPVHFFHPEFGEFSQRNLIARNPVPGQGNLMESEIACGGDLLNQRKRDECEQIAAHLTATGGNAAQAARRLGISRQLLHYKMKKYCLRREAFRPRL
jgi:arginine utilization regulatory protein